MLQILPQAPCLRPGAHNALPSHGRCPSGCSASRSVRSLTVLPGPQTSCQTTPHAVGNPPVQEGSHQAVVVHEAVTLLVLKPHRLTAPKNGERWYAGTMGTLCLEMPLKSFRTTHHPPLTALTASHKLKNALSLELLCELRQRMVQLAEPLSGHHTPASPGPAIPGTA